jgi:glycosyltransferase involved in cell wall biosynthesis
MSENSALSTKGSVYAPQHSVLKIGLLTSDLSHRHGWAHHSLSLINALHRAGANLTVIASHDSPDVEGLALHKLLPSVAPAERNLLLRQMLLLPRVRAILRDCDVIHTTVEPFAPLASWVAGNRPLLITGHGSYVRLWSERRWPVSEVYRQAFLRARLICVSRYTARVAQMMLPGVQTVVVNNGVDVEHFQAVADQAATLTKKGRIVLAVGAVKARKGTLELVRAMAEVRQEMPDVQCIVVGSLDAEPAYVTRVRDTIQQLGLNDCVRLLGHVPDAALMDWYRAADVFALPSMNDGWKFEGYGLVYLEASAAGLPVIGTTDCGADDAIDDGITGLLISQAQVAEQLPAAILRLLRDPALAARMAAAGREKAAHQTWDHVAARMLALYNETVASLVAVNKSGS